MSPRIPVLLLASGLLTLLIDLACSTPAQVPLELDLPADAGVDATHVTHVFDAGTDAAADAAPARRDGGAAGGCPVKAVLPDDVLDAGDATDGDATGGDATDGDATPGDASLPGDDSGDGGDAAASGGYAPFQQLATPSTVEAVAIADLNGDGRNDVAAITAMTSTGSPDGELLVYLQQLDGTLAAAAHYTIGWSNPQVFSESLAIGDFNDDGRTDVAVADSTGPATFLQTADGTLAPIQFPSGISTISDFIPNFVRAGDFNSDGRMDLAALSIEMPIQQLGIYLQSATGTFGATPDTYAVSYDPAFHSADVGDMDGDGRTDLVILNEQGFGDAIHIVYQEASGKMGLVAPYAFGSDTIADGLAVGDVTGDCLADVVVTSGADSTPGYIVFPQKGGNLAAPLITPSSGEGAALRLADVDGDGLLDAIALYDDTGHVGVALQLSNGTLAPETRYTIPLIQHPTSEALAVGDITGDGKPDLVIADHDDDGIVILNHR